MWGGAFDPTLGYYIINTTDSGALHFIQNEPQPKPAPSYADPDHQSPILYSTQPGSAQSASNFVPTLIVSSVTRVDKPANTYAY